MIVVDTSMIAYLLLEGKMTVPAEEVLKRDPQWSAPLLWRSEFSSVLLRYIRSGELLPDLALRMLDQAQVILAGREYQISSHKAIDLAANSDCSVHECEFVTLAMDLKTLLVTNDQRVIKAFPGTAVSVDDFLKRGQTPPSPVVEK